MTCLMAMFLFAMYIFQYYCAWRTPWNPRVNVNPVRSPGRVPMYASTDRLDETDGYHYTLSSFLSDIYNIWPDGTSRYTYMANIYSTKYSRGLPSINDTRWYTQPDSSTGRSLTPNCNLKVDPYDADVLTKQHPFNLGVLFKCCNNNGTCLDYVYMICHYNVRTCVNTRGVAVPAQGSILYPYNVGYRNHVVTWSDFLDHRLTHCSKYHAVIMYATVNYCFRHVEIPCPCYDKSYGNKNL